jgi:hypothetical protein
VKREKSEIRNQKSAITHYALRFTFHAAERETTMCGGVIFPYRKEYAKTLAELFSRAEVEEIERSGQVRSLYWQRGAEPVLPVVTRPDDGEEPRHELILWGNRNKDIQLPQTGWARLDSVSSGKWSFRKPEHVLIPVTYGVEKGKWFRIENGIEGITVQRDGARRVYMLTDDADEEYLASTHHERMPVLVNQPHPLWLPGDPIGTNHAL